MGGGTPEVAQWVAQHVLAQWHSGTWHSWFFYAASRSEHISRKRLRTLCRDLKLVTLAIS